MQQLGVFFAQLAQLPRYGSRVGLHIVLFEACSAFTRVAACTLALSPIRDTLIEGFSHFVTSMTAPIASGWGDCRVGLAPTGKRRLCTAHATSRHCLKSLNDFVGALLEKLRHLNGVATLLKATPQRSLHLRLVCPVGRS